MPMSTTSTWRPESVPNTVCAIISVSCELSTTRRSKTAAVDCFETSPTTGFQFTISVRNVSSWEGSRVGILSEHRCVIAPTSTLSFSPTSVMLINRPANSWRLFVRTHYPLKLLALASYPPVLRNRSKKTATMDKSAARTPAIRDACPSVSGRFWSSLNRASALSPATSR